MYAARIQPAPLNLDELERTGYSGSTRFASARLSDYPDSAAKRGAMGRRTLGIGVINFAYWLAKTVNVEPDGSANSDA